MNKKTKVILIKIGGTIATAMIVALAAKYGYIMSPEEVVIVKSYITILLGI